MNSNRDQARTGHVARKCLELAKERKASMLMRAPKIAILAILFVLSPPS